MAIFLRTHKKKVRKYVSDSEPWSLYRACNFWQKVKMFVLELGFYC